MTETKRSKLTITIALLNGVFVAVAAYALVETHRVQSIATRQMELDTKIEAGLAELVRTESQQLGPSQTILALYDQADNASQQGRERAAKQLAVLAARVDDRSSQVAQLAHEASEEHDTYASLVKELMQAGNENQNFVERVHTLQRLSQEGRSAEADRSALELRESTESRTLILNALQHFQAAALARSAEYHERQRVASWWLLGAIASTLALWTFYFKYRWRQTRIELARIRATKAPRAEHLKYVRTQAEPCEAELPGEQPLAGCRVLAAEDGPHNQRFIKRVLTKAGAEVVIAENGDAATKLVFTANKANEPFDVVLMDMQMPVMDGLEATKTLRRFHYQGPIVAVSAQSQSSDREACLNGGCDAYLAKPINHVELAAIVQKFFALRTSAAEPVAAE